VQPLTPEEQRRRQKGADGCGGRDGQAVQPGATAARSFCVLAEVPLVDAQAARLTLVLDRQSVIGGELLGEHAVRYGSDPLVVVEVALPAPGQALDGVGVQSVRLDQAARGVARRQHRPERALLTPDRQLDVLLGANGLRHLLAELRVVLIEDVLRAGVIPDRGRELARD